MGFAPENFDTSDMFTETPTIILDGKTPIIAYVADSPAIFHRFYRALHGRKRLYNDVVHGNEMDAQPSSSQAITDQVDLEILEVVQVRPPIPT
jgi:hypothetical protein